MPVFYVHDPSRGIITPLDSKYYVRHILEPDELNEIQRTHRKIKPTPEKIVSQSIQSESSEQKKLADSYNQTRSSDEEHPIRATAREVMTSPVLSITEDHRLQEALTFMQQHQIHHLAVTKENQTLKGLISKRDLLDSFSKDAASQDNVYQDNVSQDSASQNSATHLMDLPLSYFCTKPVISASPDVNISELAKVMLEQDYDAIAITENATLVGLITYADIIKTLIKHKSLESFA